MPEGNFELIKLNNLIETQINTQKIANNDVTLNLFQIKKKQKFCVILIKLVDY